MSPWLQQRCSATDLPGVVVERETRGQRRVDLPSVRISSLPARRDLPDVIALPEVELVGLVC